MDARIRPSLAELTADYDEPAFPELDHDAPPAVRVQRTRPPTVLSTSFPPPIPVIQPDPSRAAEPAPAPAKHKSRFALQREKEAAERAAAASGRAERFELNLDAEEDEAFEPWRPSSKPSVVKDILERPVSKATPPQPPSAPGPPRPSPLGATRPTGFPSSSRGLFPRKPSSQPSPSPVSASPAPRGLPPNFASDADELSAGGSTSAEDILASVSRENEDVVRGMSEAQILEEQRQIREELGLSEGVLKMLAARGAKRGKEGKAAPAAGAKAQPEEEKDEGPQPRTRPLPADAPTAPPLPASKHLDDEAEEEGSPEYIRRHFFPNEPPNPALDWMRNAPSAPRASTPDTLQGMQLRNFDLNGAALPDSAAFDPAHVHSAACGEHHVSSASSFTIPSLVSLVASSVPSQRSTAFTVLHRILSHPSNHAASFGEKEWDGFRLQVATRAGWALRDPNMGVVGAAVALVAALLGDELKRPRTVASAMFRLPNAEEPQSVLSNFLATSPLPFLAAQLSYNALPRPALLQILDILSSLVQLARDAPSPSIVTETLDTLTSAPRLLDSLISRFVATPWPPAPSAPSSPADTPTPLALHLLTLLASSSRTRAKVLVEQHKAAEAPLRFIAIPPWELASFSPGEQKLGDDLLVATLEFWTALGRYGLATGLRTKAAPLLDGLAERATELVNRQGAVKGEERWVARYLELLSVWTTAAIDPHVTAHDIKWSEVDGWKELAVEAVEWALKGEGEGEGEVARENVLVAALGLLGSWMEGSKVNKSWRGEVERKWLRGSAVGRAFEVGGAAAERARSALERLAGGSGAAQAEAQLAAAALRLSDAYAEPIEPKTPHLFKVKDELAERVVRAIVSRPTSSASNAVALSLLPRLDLATRLSLVIDLLPLLRAEDAVAARDQVDWLLRVVASPSNANLAPLAALSPSLEFPCLASAATLRPFITHSIVTTSGGRVVGPLYPSPRDVKLTACLAPFAPSEPVLPPNWPLVALNELLRSATSPVFEQLPAGTEISELQLVRSSLALMRLVASAASSSYSRVPAPALVYDLIKVFMLEKDGGDLKGSSGAESELFRDEAVQHSMAALLASISVAQQDVPQLLLPDTRPPVLTIEGVSSTVSSAPFYQLYTDLVGLYDSISLSDRLFGLVLLPPLSMSYPLDYRRLLWTDYSHILRNLRFTADEVIADKQGEGALSSYLDPREENESILAAYLDALVSGTVRQETTPFLHLVATHHIAAALFAEAAAEPLRLIASRLATSLVFRQAGPVLRMLLEYGQGRQGEEVRMPPSCYGVVDEALRGVRTEKLRALVGKGLEEKLDALICL
ncbi:hypothetical protein JCM6882_003475 [Rhodosporidiobolus microsporus]